MIDPYFYFNRIRFVFPSIYKLLSFYVRNTQRKKKMLIELEFWIFCDYYPCNLQTKSYHKTFPECLKINKFQMLKNSGVIYK